MEQREAVATLLASVLNQLAYHPLFSPYLRTSVENPPQHYLHQYEVVVRLAPRKPIRVLIGDEIGLGKTVTAIAIAKYLENLGRVKRTLIVVPRVLVLQWSKELTRMGISAIRIKHLEKSSIESYRAQGFPEGYYVASMDLLKKEEVMSEIKKVNWDLIIVDEAHRLGYRTERFRKIGGELIGSEPSRNVIFLSATPHRGDPRDYIHRLRLLDPHLVENWRSLDKKSFYEATHGSILFRRTKEDVNNIYEGKKIFTDAKFYACLITGRKDENEFVKKLVDFLRTKLNEFARERNLISEKVIPLLKIIVFKRATSSPYSAWRTFRKLLLERVKRVKRDIPEELVTKIESFLKVGYEDLEYEEDPEKVFSDFLDATSSLLSPDDAKKIEELRDAAYSIMEKGDTKLNAVISLLEDIMNETNSKVIIFTEYKDTLDYLVKSIKERRPEWSQSVLSLSSEDVQNKERFNKIRASFEKDPEARILIATDVVAEGVNLQVANIVINYEIPWSLVKLEQRIGRVWRLGQKKDVVVYTFFMNNVADKAALDLMYQKLLNLRRAELQPKLVTGQEALYYAEAKDVAELPSSVALTRVENKKKKFISVTEAMSIKTYLEKGESGLQELVSQIIAAKQKLEKELSSKGVLYRPRNREEVERVIKLTGFKDHKEIFNSLKKLLKASAPMLDVTLLEEGEDVKIQRGLEMPAYVRTLDDFYAILAGKSDVNEAVCVVARGDSEALISLIPVWVRDRRDNALLYASLVGVNLRDGRIFTGSSLLDIISLAIENFVGVEKPDDRLKEIPQHVYVDIVNEVNSVTYEILDAVNMYRSRLKDGGLRKQEDVWIRNSDIHVTLSNPVGYLHFVKLSSKPPEDLPEDIKRDIERKAIEKVLAEEIAEGRTPYLVPETEHYDVKSIDPSTGEVRLIEVKGHKGLEIYAELTEAEFELASREKERYWLYIVYDIGSGEPKIMKFHNPLETMNIQVFERVQVQRRYLLRPKI